jgi:DNA-binding CsgD family transcriptional regulator
MYRFNKQIWLTAALLLTLTACGGGGGGDTVVTTSATTSFDVFDGAAIGCSVSSDATTATEVGDGAYTFATVLDAGTVVIATGCTDTDTQSLLPALSGVVQSGAVVISPITTLIVEAELSKRQREIAKLYAKGLTRIEISNKLGITQNTVVSHLDKIFERLEINNKA